uniref:Uncharacterized protein n=1 Tax=Fagus sylvatica TaxID=28930 RepID=A0A2N9EC10_FAGSY
MIFSLSSFSFPSLCSPLSPLFSIDDLGSLLILETDLGLPAWWRGGVGNGQKRKLEQEIEEEREISIPSEDAKKALLSEVGADRAATKRATHVLAELAKNGINYQQKSKFPKPFLSLISNNYLFAFFNFLIFTILFGSRLGGGFWVCRSRRGGGSWVCRSWRGGGSWVLDGGVGHRSG